MPFGGPWESASRETGGHVTETSMAFMSGEVRFFLRSWTRPTDMKDQLHHDARMFIGTSGYSYPDWKGVVYPKFLKREVGDSTTPELTYLSRYFNTCEINATFYRNFEPEIAKKWSDAVENPEFEFAIKANQVFTHATGSKPSERKAPTSVETLMMRR